VIGLRVKLVETMVTFQELQMKKSDSVFPFPELETPRLHLRLLTLDDTESVYQHFSDDDVTRFMDIPSCTSREEAQEIIEFHLEDDGCRWGLIDKESGGLVGTCGYHCWDRNLSTPMAEIGFDLRKANWGQGLMRETLQTVIPFGFDVMKPTKIYASVEPQNDRCLRLLGNLNFQVEPDLRDGLQWFNLLKN